MKKVKRFVKHIIRRRLRSPSAEDHRRIAALRQGISHLAPLYGPPHSAMVQFLTGTGAALIISDESISNWSQIADTIKNPSSRRLVLEAAAKLAREQLATDVMRNRWRRAVEQLEGDQK